MAAAGRSGGGGDGGDGVSGKSRGRGRGIAVEPVVAMVARSKTKRLATHRREVAEAVSHTDGRRGPVRACWRRDEQEGLGLRGTRTTC